MFHDLSNVWLGFDRDGTLELPGRPPTAAFIARLHNVRDRGAKVFFASGKDMEFLETLGPSLGVSPTVIAAENGGHIRRFNDDGTGPNDVIQEPSADLADFIAGVGQLRLPKCGPEPKRSIWSRKFGLHSLEAAAILEKFIADHGWHLDVLCHPDVDGGLDVVPVHVNKALVSSSLPAGAIVHYFGDSDNDLPLMQLPAIAPHAPANAKESVKQLVRGRGGLVADRPVSDGLVDLLVSLFG